MHSDCDCRAPIVGSVLFQIPHWKYLVDPDWKGTAKGCSEYAGSQQAEWKNRTGRAHDSEIAIQEDKPLKATEMLQSDPPRSDPPLAETERS